MKCLKNKQKVVKKSRETNKKKVMACKYQSQDMGDRASTSLNQLNHDSFFSNHDLKNIKREQNA